MLPEIDRADKELEQATQKRTEIIEACQKNCSHPREAIRECDYVPMDYVNHLPPMRVCILCGTSEEGWGCGYKILIAKDVPIIAREELYKYRRSGNNFYKYGK